MPQGGARIKQMAEHPLLHSARFPTIQGLPAQKKSKFHPSTFDHSPCTNSEISEVKSAFIYSGRCTDITHHFRLSQLFKKIPSCIPQNSKKKKKYQEHCQYISLHVQFCHGTFNIYKYNFRKKKLITTWLLTMNKN